MSATARATIVEAFRATGAEVVATHWLRTGLPGSVWKPDWPPLTTVKAGAAGVSSLRARFPWTISVALTLFLVLATSIFSARHAAYAESVSNVTYKTVRVQSGDSLWSLAQEHPIEGLSTQETSDMIRNVNHLEHGSLDAGAHLKVPARS